MDYQYCIQYEPLWGSWYITKLIGEGSYGSVFEIEKSELGHSYKAALKAISVPPSQNDAEDMKMDGLDDEGVTTYYTEVAQNMMNEFTIMSEMKGESNIVSIEDVSTFRKKEGIGWDIFVRMELLSPVETWFKQNAPDQSEILRMGIDICRALELCEENHIIHRDIKPANIFMSKAGHYKLGDFGVSRMVEGTSAASTRVGTLSYMAPEVYLGQRYDHTVDIYSMGLVLYRYLNHGRLPFLPDYPAQIRPSDREIARFRLFRGDPLPMPAGIGDALSDILVKACAFNPEDRYQSARDMGKDLLMVLKDNIAVKGKRSPKTGLMCSS